MNKTRVVFLDNLPAKCYYLKSFCTCCYGFSKCPNKSSGPSGFFSKASPPRTQKPLTRTSILYSVLYLVTCCVCDYSYPSITSGMLVSFAVGQMLSWRGLAQLGATLSLLPVPLLLLVPETPQYLTSTGSIKPFCPFYHIDHHNSS